MASQKVASAYIDLQLQTAAFKAAINEATGEMKKFSAQTREEMAKSRESVKLLSEELGLGIPRGLQGIISKLPGVTTAMNAAFDAVVVFALIKTVVEVTEKVAEFIKKNEEAAKRNATAWTSIHTSIQTQNDDLELTKIKLENAIAKLEHKPENKLAEAIAEARVEADKLGDKIEQVVKQIQEAVKGEQAGDLYKLFANQTGGTATGKVIEDLRLKLANIDNGFTKGDPTQARQAALQEARDALRPIIQASHATMSQSLTVMGQVREAAESVALVTPFKQSAAIAAGRVPTDPAAAKIEYETATEAARNIQGALGVAGNTQQVNALQGKQGRKIDADAAAKARLKAIQDEYEKETLLHQKSTQEQEDYWKKYLNTFRYNTDEWRAIAKSWTTAHDAGQADIFKSLMEFQPKIEPRGLVTPFDEESLKAAKDTTDAQQKAARDIFTGAFEDLKQKEQIAELLIKIEEANGRLTANQAVQQLAALHATTQAATTQAFGAAQNTGANFNLKEAGLYSPQAAVAQQLQDTQDQWKTSFPGQVAETFNAIIAESENWGTQFKSTIEGALSDVNNAIIHLLTTRPQPGDHPFRQAGVQIFGGVARSGLEDAEGQIMKLLHLGSGKVQKVHVENWPTIGASGSPAGAISSAVSAATGAVSSGSGGFWNGLFHGIGKFAGFMETGGVMSPGDFYMTGEKGPELIQVGSTSRINSARDTSSLFGSGDTYHNWNIDARGSTDPAAVRAQVMAGIRQAAPHIVAASTQSQKDHASRIPRSK